MTKPMRFPAQSPDDQTVNREAKRILRRLCEPATVLAVARDMEEAVVVREAKDGSTTRTSAVDRPNAQAMVLKDWISCDVNGRISRYRITGAGRAALKQLLADGEVVRLGFFEAPARFLGQSREMDAENRVAPAVKMSLEIDILTLNRPSYRWRDERTRTANDSLDQIWFRQPNGCAKILKFLRWVGALRRTGTVF